MKLFKRWLLEAGNSFILKPSGGVRILLFHEVKKSQFQAFESVIRFVGERYGFISPDNYSQYSHKKEIRYIVSFDDGFASELEVTREILEPLGIKALFFVCPGFVGLNEKEAAGFMRGPMRRIDVAKMSSEFHPLSWSDLTMLLNKGHVIGSHSMNHANLSGIQSEEELAIEILSSGDELEKKLGRVIDWFSYPFGGIKSINSKSLRMIAKRYKYCCSGLRGTNNGATNRLCLTRENIDFNENLADLKQIADGGFDIFYYFQRKRLLKMAEYN
ncbi:MAG: polysaccharide deacetylase family protein [Syntrophaceae bacterium]